MCVGVCEPQSERKEESSMYTPNYVICWWLHNHCPKVAPQKRPKLQIKKRQRKYRHSAECQLRNVKLCTSIKLRDSTFELVYMLFL